LNDLGTNTPDRNAEGVITITGTAAEIPTLVVPVDEPVEFALSSGDVIHSFYVKDFLYKLDVIPGRDNRFVVIPREIGSYYAQCAELCGIDHALMRFTLEVKSRADFDTWVSEQKVTAPDTVKAAP
jgi:cytochrome c oxidase subunit 2